MDVAQVSNLSLASSSEVGVCIQRLLLTLRGERYKALYAVKLTWKLLLSVADGVVITGWLILTLISIYVKTRREIKHSMYAMVCI